MSENTLGPGDSIAGHSIVRKVGEGGYGVVYEATDPKDGRVAIKVLRAELVGDPSIRERLSREVMLSAVSSGGWRRLSLRLDDLNLDCDGVC